MNIGNGEFFSNAKRQDSGGASHTQGCATAQDSDSMWGPPDRDKSKRSRDEIPNVSKSGGPQSGRKAERRRMGWCPPRWFHGAFLQSSSLLR
jgi:hypothetical protein